MSAECGYLQHPYTAVPVSPVAVVLSGSLGSRTHHQHPCHSLLVLEVAGRVGANPDDEIITDCSLGAVWTLRSEAVEGHNHEGMTGSRRYPRISFILAKFRNPESWDILGYPDPGINRDYPDLHLCTLRWALTVP